jgi:riboflavin kinase / FMN adenylyltransferase
MKVYRDLVPHGALGRGTAVTIGAYDGVHRGHRAVLRLVHELAIARDLATVVVTFDRHPAEIVRPESAPTLLTTLDQKLELLDATDLVDACVVIGFDDSRSKETAPEFVHEVLHDNLRAELVVVGADFHFGYRRGGNVALLEGMGADLGFEVIGLGLVKEQPGEPPFSSTRVRELLAAGQVEGAAQILGRDHEVRGRVETGDQRGRQLGFPTANVAIADRTCLPADGVYAGTLVGADGTERFAAISLGRRPTFYEEHGLLLLEAYVLDFDGDLYAQDVRVRFRARIRGQVRFERVEDLIAQMQTDVARCRELLA